MARFVFRLQALLTAREREEERCQRAVADVERERRSLEDRLRQLHQGIQDGVAEVRSALVGEVAVDALRSHAGARLQAMRDAEKTVRELAAIQRRLDTAREALIESTRDRRAIELLKEQQFEQWKRDLERREDAALDELAVMRAGLEARTREDAS